MSILKAACIGIAGTFLALQFQNTRKEYGIYLGIAVSIFLFLGMSRNQTIAGQIEVFARLSILAIGMPILKALLLAIRELG